MAGKQQDPQASLFDKEEHDKWKEDWQNMPEFNQKDLAPWKSIVVHFENDKDLKEFAKLVGQNLTHKTRSIWYPEAEIGRMTDKLFVNEEALLKEDSTNHILEADEE